MDSLDLASGRRLCPLASHRMKHMYFVLRRHVRAQARMRLGILSRLLASVDPVRSISRSGDHNQAISCIVKLEDDRMQAATGEVDYPKLLFAKCKVIDREVTKEESELRRPSAAFTGMTKSGVRFREALQSPRPLNTSRLIRRG